jgi:hypothetical protein
VTEDAVGPGPFDEVPIVAEQEDLAPVPLVVSVVGNDDRFVALLALDLDRLFDVPDAAVADHAEPTDPCRAQRLVPVRLESVTEGLDERVGVLALVVPVQLIPNLRRQDEAVDVPDAAVWVVESEQPVEAPRHHVRVEPGEERRVTGHQVRVAVAGDKRLAVVLVGRVHNAASQDSVAERVLFREVVKNPVGMPGADAW